jgi:phage terminase large subunit-like protein
MSEATVETFAALLNRMGKRPGSKVIGISTPSFTEDNALLHIQRAMRSGQPMPGVQLTEYISEQTDHRDESQWHRANPALVTKPAVLDMDAVRTSLVALPEMQFRCYRLCQNPTGAQSCWLNSLDDNDEETGDGYDVWMRGASAQAFRDGAPTWCGVDVAKSRDHAAAVWGQFRDDGRLHAKCKVWTPTKTADIDLEEIADHLRMLDRRYDLREVDFDPSYFFNAPALEREGLPMVAVPPTEQRMAPLCGHAYHAIRRSRITHDDHEQFTKHVLAGKRRYCAHGFTIEKRQFSQKCDAAIALVLMHGAATGFAEPAPTDADFLTF